MKKIIIGIHGLNNKPPKRILEKWWKRALREGLTRSGFNGHRLRFELAYWAHILHPKPLNPNIRDKSHPLYLSAPYYPGNPPDSKNRKQENSVRKKVLDTIENQMDKIFLNDDMSLNYSAITDLVVRHFFSDLDRYYSADRENNSSPLRESLREPLAAVLRKHRGKKICLIAHSMGSIIAYDVLTQTVPNIPVHTLITIGSPLGIPVIISKIAAEQKRKRVRTPENITGHWFNFSDLEDKIAMNYSLADDFLRNKKGVNAADQTIVNDYRLNGKRNPHKSYGYLRAPELATALSNFFGDGKDHFYDGSIRYLKKVFG